MSAVFPKTIDEAFARITPEACKSLLGQGVNFAVACETQGGRWLVLHAVDLSHALNIAKDRVHHFLCRGASVWRIYPDGLATRKCAAIYEDVWDED